MSVLHVCSRRFAVVCLLLGSMLMSGCAMHNVRDPLEPLNRGIYAINEGLDFALLQPIASGYRALMPQIVRTGVRNFFSNLDDVVVIANGLLQFKFSQAFSDTARFMLNSTVGLLGLIDVATTMGLEKHFEDFGQTLGVWGMSDGPYLVLPIIGPSSFRDGLGLWADSWTHPLRYIDHSRTRNQFVALGALNRRHLLLDTDNLIDAAAIDRYEFIRDAYFQRRRNLVHDGNPPPETEDDAPAKPRSGIDAAPTVLLTDQWGAPVAGIAPAGGGYAETLTKATSVAPPPVALPVNGNGNARSPAAEGADGAVDAPGGSAATSEVDPATTAQAADMPAATTAPRVVRVWLPESRR